MHGAKIPFRSQRRNKHIPEFNHRILSSRREGQRVRHIAGSEQIRVKSPGITVLLSCVKIQAFGQTAAAAAALDADAAGLFQRRFPVRIKQLYIRGPFPLESMLGKILAVIHGVPVLIHIFVKAAPENIDAVVIIKQIIRSRHNRENIHPRISRLFIKSNKITLCSEIGKITVQIPAGRPHHRTFIHQIVRHFIGNTGHRRLVRHIGTQRMHVRTVRRIDNLYRFSIQMRIFIRRRAVQRIIDFHSQRRGQLQRKGFFIKSRLSGKGQLRTAVLIIQKQQPQSAAQKHQT